MNDHSKEGKTIFPREVIQRMRDHYNAERAKQANPHGTLSARPLLQELMVIVLEWHTPKQKNGTPRTAAGVAEEWIHRNGEPTVYSIGVWLDGAGFGVAAEEEGFAKRQGEAVA